MSDCLPAGFAFEAALKQMKTKCPKAKDKNMFGRIVVFILRHARSVKRWSIQNN